MFSPHRRTLMLATDSQVPSGVGEHMLTLASGLATRMPVVLAFTRDGETQRIVRRAEAAGITTATFGDDDFGVVLQDHDVDILHVHAGIGWEGHRLAEAGWTAGLPVVRTEHLPYLLTDEEQVAAYRASLGLVDRLIVVSEAAGVTYRDQGIADSRIHVVRNGVVAPVPSVSGRTVRDDLGLGDDQVMVLTAARFTPQKGHRALVEAASHVVARHPHVIFLLAGSGPYRVEIEALVAERGLSDHVRFLGDRDDVPALMAACNVFALPSLFEGLPLVVLEAMACGVPIVATAVGGTTDALGDDYPWLCRADDVNELAKTIEAAATDRAMRIRIGQRNRDRFARDFQAARMVTETAAVYDQLSTRRLSAA